MSILDINMELCAAAVPMYTDIQGSMYLATSGAVNHRTKQIDECYHFHRQAIADKVFEIRYCPTENMVAGLLTKQLSGMKQERLVKMIGLGRISHG